MKNWYSHIQLYSPIPIPIPSPSSSPSSSPCSPSSSPSPSPSPSPSSSSSPSLYSPVPSPSPSSSLSLVTHRMKPHTVPGGWGTGHRCNTLLQSCTSSHPSSARPQGIPLSPRSSTLPRHSSHWLHDTPCHNQRAYTRKYNTPLPHTVPLQQAHMWPRCSSCQCIPWYCHSHRPPLSP